MNNINFSKTKQNGGNGRSFLKETNKRNEMKKIIIIALSSSFIE
jgi:hypothetical protein